MKLLKILFYCCLVSSSLFGQNIADSLVWAKEFSNQGLSNLLVETDDLDNIYVAATYDACSECFVAYDFSFLASQGNGSTEILLAKLNSDGELVASLLVGGPGDDVIAGFKVDEERNVLLFIRNQQAVTIGSTILEQGHNVLKFDNSFNLLWALNLQGSIHSTHDSPIAALWEQFDVTPESEVVIGGRVFVTEQDSSLMIGDELFTVDRNSAFIAKIDQNGQLAWARILEHEGFFSDLNITSVSAAKVGEGIHVLGYFNEGALIIGNDTLIADTTNQFSRRNTFLFKLADNGAPLWAKKYYTGLNTVDLISDSSGNLIASGYFNFSAYFELDTISVEGASDFAVFKVDPAGNYLWSLTLGDNTTNDHCYLAANADDEIYISGNISSLTGAIMSKISSTGELLWNFDPQTFNNRSGADVTFDNSGHLIQACTYTGNFRVGDVTFQTGVGAGGWQSVVMKFSGQSDAVLSSINAPNEPEVTMQLFPNPVADELRLTYQLPQREAVKVILYDLRGRPLSEKNILSTEQGEVRFSVDHLPSGSYFITLYSKRFTVTKMVLVED